MDGAPTLADDDLGAARAGDDAAFERLVGPLRRELHAHCYRMLGSAHDADDALQDALLRAWRGFARFEGRSTVRSWLYTVATRTCLDLVEARGRRALPMDLGPASSEPVLDDAPATEVAWLTPYPDTALAVEQRESVELAFVAALQHLPGNQRAALLLFEVLSYSAAEIAAMMETSTASVNSALQRARRLVAERVPPVSQQRTLAALDDARLRAVVDGYARALEHRDAGALVSLLTEDVTWSMPPLPGWYSGREDVMAFARAVPLGDCGTWRALTTEANGQPAVALYLDGPATRGGAGEGGRFRAWSLTVLTLRGGSIAELTSFLGPEVFHAHGLPLSLDP
ncbi:sigma-70 family RNA polymerase sigma factor [Actinomycetospora sp.]|jgi:RNA polymerase sigma-70 factor (ECF subfamily)|uniref:sigma-70 family RNA polymerase sigma factor n=1 Tax=Actinomycetospora sp. TaxID=1872135 RepID=UPI002F418D55